MRIALLLLATLVPGVTLWSADSAKSVAPYYSAASVVNSATNTSVALAPNAIATVYGANLSYDTGWLTAENTHGGMLPDKLAGVRVMVAGIAASLYYVSPKQINFLVPSNLQPGDVTLLIAREGTAGPQVTITLHEAGPGFYELEPGRIAATHANGAVITRDRPAHAGEVVVLYGTGFGRTNPDVVSGLISMTAAQIQNLSVLQVWVDGKTVDRARISYAGVTPGTPGLYQLNLKLPDQVAANPEVRIAIGASTSPPAVHLDVR
jgi:uncharacterized protein (TIGR03437 family)